MRGFTVTGSVFASARTKMNWRRVPDFIVAYRAGAVV